MIQCPSHDPNDILGPLGIGDEHWVTIDTPFDFTIRYENDAELALSPAQTVRIVQQLDDDLDWSSFRLGMMGFGDVVITAANGLSSYQGRIDLLDQYGIYVDVSAAIDISTGNYAKIIIRNIEIVK